MTRPPPENVSITLTVEPTDTDLTYSICDQNVGNIRVSFISDLVSGSGAVKSTTFLRPSLDDLAIKVKPIYLGNLITFAG